MRTFGVILLTVEAILELVGALSLGPDGVVECPNVGRHVPSQDLVRCQDQARKQECVENAMHLESQ